MLEPRTEATDSASKTASPVGEFRGFNRTGREDTAVEILRPQVDPAVRRRNLMLIGVVALLLVIVGGLAFSRSHLSLVPQGESEKSEKEDKAFAPGNTGEPQ